MKTPLEQGEDKGGVVGATASANPPAFPFPETRDFNGFGIREGSDGMSLRDWFAGQAISEAFRYAASHPDSPFASDYLPEEWGARIAYGIADAMLAERAKS